MSKKLLSVSVLLFGLAFSQITADCFAELIYERKGLSDSKRAELLYGYVTTMWPSDEIWPQMRVALKKIGDGDYVASEGAVDQLRVDYSENQYLPVALHEIAKLYRLVEERGRSLQLHQYVVDNWPSHEYTMWSLRDLAILNIALGDLKAAQAAINRALTDFANNVYIAFVGYDIAGYYKDFAHYQEAKELYEYVIAHWPEHEDYVHWCETGLREANLALADQAVSESEITTQVELAKVAIASGNITAAETAVSTLLTTYPGNPRVGRPLFDIAEYYRQCGKYEKAKQLYQYVVDTWPQHVSARWSQLGVAICHIVLGDMQAAEAATEKLFADFPDSELMAGCVYEIGNAYNQSGNYKKAKQFYQSVLDAWPEYMHTMWAQIGLAQANIGLGDSAAAEAIVNGLITQLDSDFPGGTGLSSAAAEGYYDAGDCYRKLGKYKESTASYEKIINNCPDYEYAWNAQFLIGQNYQDLKKAGAISASEADQQTRAVYRQLIKRYPDCPAAKPAQQWLERQND